MTIRLYYTNAYQTTFAARVVDRSDDGQRVYLDQTAFYPTSGGQPHDVGSFAGIPIVDVIDEGDRIAHVLAAPLSSSPGDELEGTIEWTRRFDHMQQHTGQHLLSALFEDLFGAHTVSVHFGPETSTLDLDVELLAPEQVGIAEERANGAVAEARAVTVSFEDAETAAGLRKPSDRGGTLRVVTIASLDRSACGGTHVRSTSEIGVILLRGTERVRKTTRVMFVCGRRALRRARRDLDALTQVAAALSSSIDDAPAAVAAQMERIKENESGRKRMDRELAAFRARERYDAVVPGDTGARTIVVRDAGSMDELRMLAQAALALPRVIVLGMLATPPSVLVAASEDSGLDAGKLLKERLSRAGGRGGGSPRIAQGSVPDLAVAESIVNELLSART